LIVAPEDKTDNETADTIAANNCVAFDMVISLSVLPAQNVVRRRKSVFVLLSFTLASYRPKGIIQTVGLIVNAA
jgi:hypothetical protein